MRLIKFSHRPKSSTAMRYDYKHIDHDVFQLTIQHINRSMSSSSCFAAGAKQYNDAHRRVSPLAKRLAPIVPSYAGYLQNSDLQGSLVHVRRHSPALSSDFERAPNFPTGHDETGIIPVISVAGDAEEPQKPSLIPASRNLQKTASISSWKEEPAEPAAYRPSRPKLHLLLPG